MAWTIQIHRHRGLWDRVRGRNRLGGDNAQIAAIAVLLRGQSDFDALEETLEA